jgi:hypothetical protein
MKDSQDKKQVMELISQDFCIEKHHFLSEPANVEAIRNWLKSILDHLLENDFERLLNAMYRLDIDESKFQEVLSGVYGNDVSGKLAEIIIERELRKVETRKRYQGL